MLNQCITRLMDVNVVNNPFNDRSWNIYVSQSDPGIISEEDAQASHYVIAYVDNIIKPKGILFSYDAEGERYFTHVNSYQGSNNQDWYDLAPKRLIAISPNYNCKGELPVSTEMYIIKDN